MNTKYTVAELNSKNTETPYPSVEINSPPGGSINYTTVPLCESLQSAHPRQRQKS